MQHSLAEQHFNCFEDVKKWLNDWIIQKAEKFLYDGIQMLPKRWAKVVDNNGNYFD